MGLRAAVAGVAVLGVLVAGCGDGSDDATEEVSTVTIDLLDQTVDGGTVRFEMTMEAPEGGSPSAAPDVISAEGSGVVDFEAGDSDVTTTVVIGPAPADGSVDPVVTPGATSFQLRQVGDRTFARQTSGSDDDAPWVEQIDGDEDGVHIEAEGGDGLLGQLFDPTGFDPRGALEALRAATDEVTEEGREDVRGEPATRYRAIVDGEELGPDAATDGDTPLDVWIDDEGRLRRIEVSGLRLDLFDYGVPVEIEVPTDIGTAEDAEGWFGMGQPTVAGEWQVQADGATPDGVGWAVWAAPHELDGAAYTCRTLEVDGRQEVPGVVPEGFDVDAFVPNHDGVPATCGYSSWFGTPVTTNDPSVQILQADGSGAVGDPESLVAFAVDERWSGDPVRLVRDGADDVVLDVDASGVALWVPDGSEPITQVWLGGEAVRCDVIDFGDLMEDAAEDLEEGSAELPEDLPDDLPEEMLPDELAWLAPIYVGSCVEP